jgi:hypothetical protein
MTNSFSTTSSFTLTHAKYLASKVATDLHRFQRLYGGVPSDQTIADYEGELTELLKHDAVQTATYGFKRNGVWTQAVVKYVTSSGGLLLVDDDPGKIRANLDVSGASFTSYLTYSPKWWAMPEPERAHIKARLPIQRTTGDEPGLEAGHWQNDLSYGAGGRALARSTVKV